MCLLRKQQTGGVSTTLGSAKLGVTDASLIFKVITKRVHYEHADIMSDIIQTANDPVTSLWPISYLYINSPKITGTGYYREFLSGVAPPPHPILLIS